LYEAFKSGVSRLNKTGMQTSEVSVGYSGLGQWRKASGYFLLGA